MFLVEETDDRFYIDESTVPNAGLGLFAQVDLKKGDYLEIIGVRIKSGSVSDKCTHYGDKYKFAANGKIRKGQKEVDKSHMILPLGYGGIVNHAPDPKLQNAEIWYRNGPKRNAAAGKAVYRFIRDIKKDEEVLGNYGEMWSQVMEWATEKAEEVEDAWETFLGYNLYNLGVLTEKINYKE